MQINQSNFNACEKERRMKKKNDFKWKDSTHKKSIDAADLTDASRKRKKLKRYRINDVQSLTILLLSVHYGSRDVRSSKRLERMTEYTVRAALYSHRLAMVAVCVSERVNESEIECGWTQSNAMRICFIKSGVFVVAPLILRMRHQKQCDFNDARGAYVIVCVIVLSIEMVWCPYVFVVAPRGFIDERGACIFLDYSAQWIYWSNGQVFLLLHHAYYSAGA